MRIWATAVLAVTFFCLCIPPQFSPGGPSIAALVAAMSAVGIGAYFATNAPRRLPATCFGFVSGAAIGVALFSLDPVVRLSPLQMLGLIGGTATSVALICLMLASIRVRLLFVPTRDIRKCDGCGYDLRGLTTPRCPECGRQFPDERMRRISRSTRAADVD